MWEMFKKVVEESKLRPALRSHLLNPDESACQASRSEEVAIYMKQVTVGRVRLPLCSKAKELL